MRKIIRQISPVMLLLFVSMGPLFAQQNTGENLLLDADYAAFRIPGDTSNAYVEIYYLLHRYQLRYEPADSGYIAIVHFKLSLRDYNGNLLDSLSWKIGNRVSKLSVLDDTGFLIPDMISNVLPAGRYAVEIDVNNGDRTGHAAFEMKAPVFINDRLAISSIELAYRIQSDTAAAGKFVKNGLRIMPNPSGQFSQENQVLNFYAEAYGLDISPGSDSTFNVSLDILNRDGKIIQSLPPISYKKPGESAVIMNEIPIDSLKAGDYHLQAALRDGDDSAFTVANFSVTVSRETAKRAVLQGVLRDFPEADNISSPAEAAKFRDEIVFIATPDELKLFDSLNLTGKAAFQKDFWARRDPDPSTSINEFELEHYKRFQYVETTFGRFKGVHAGWRTDRGRVYMLYGEPSEIERFAPTLEARAWERWWYHGLEGGVYFIFVDFENASDYSLIHSSKQNEVKDYNWEEKVKMSVLQR